MSYFSESILFTDRPTHLYGPPDDVLVCKVLEVDIRGVWQKKPIGDGLFLESLYSSFIAESDVARGAGYTLAFGKIRLTTIPITVLNSARLEDGNYWVNFRGDKSPS